MRITVDIPTVALKYGYGTVTRAHIMTDPGEIYSLAVNGQTEREGYTSVACHEHTVEHSGRMLDVNPDLPLCRKCIHAMNLYVGAGLSAYPSTTFKRGTRRSMSPLDKRLARVYDRLRKRAWRWMASWKYEVYMVGVNDGLDAIRKELT